MEMKAKRQEMQPNSLKWVKQKVSLVLEMADIKKRILLWNQVFLSLWILYAVFYCKFIKAVHIFVPGKITRTNILDSSFFKFLFVMSVTICNPCVGTQFWVENYLPTAPESTYQWNQKQDLFISFVHQRRPFSNRCLSSCVTCHKYELKYSEAEPCIGICLQILCMCYQAIFYALLILW